MNSLKDSVGCSPFPKIYRNLTVSDFLFEFDETNPVSAVLRMSTCGEQYESFAYLGDWTRLVADKCQQRIEELRDGY